MNIELISKDDKENITTVLVKDSSDFFMNTFRRTIIEEVPTLAIETVEFKDNSSALYDEVVALRLGLLPIKTDLKSYNLPSECKCDGEGCSQCQLKLTLEANTIGPVYAESIKSKDPKCKVIHGKMPIVKLLKGQAIELEATAVLGLGKDHIKWSPANVYYRGYPILEVKDKSKAQEAVEKCEGVLKETSKGIEVQDISKWNEAYEQICEKNGIEVINSDKDFILTIESWGQLDATEIISAAADRFTKKLEEFDKLIK